MARLKEQYVNEIAPALNKKFGYKSVMQIPKLDKVVINVACGEAKENEKILDAVMNDLARSPARRLWSAVLRRALLTSSCALALPSAARSPCAVSVCMSSWIVSSTWLCPVFATSAASTATASTAAATLPAASRSRSIFPEIDFDKVDAVRGMDVCFVTTAKTDEEGKELLKALGAPFENN